MAACLILSGEAVAGAILIHSADFIPGCRAVGGLMDIHHQLPQYIHTTLQQLYLMLRLFGEENDRYHGLYGRTWTAFIAQD